MADVRNLQECNAKLGALFAEHQYPDYCVLGLDEVMMVISPDEKVLSEAPNNQRIRAPEPQWNGHVTTVGCIAADGSRYPPMYIFAGKRAPPELAAGGGLCAIGATGWLVSTRLSSIRCAVPSADSGYMNGPLFFEYIQWLEQFLPKRRPLLLVLDQHESRFNVAVLEFCNAKGIHLFALVPGLTYIQQPGDVRVHRRYQKALRLTFAEFLARNKVLCRNNVICVQYPAYLAGFSHEACSAAFSDPGIFPFDPQKLMRHPEVLRDRS